MKSTNCIILFTKAPLPSKVKTRLTQHGFLDAEQAAEVYVAFLTDVLETLSRYVSRNNIDVIISYTPKEGLRKILEVTSGLQIPVERVSFDLQEGEEFDQKMNSTFRKAFAAGYEAAVIIGGDSPTIREEYLDDAFKILSRQRDLGRDVIVVGPAKDGGVYLIGLRNVTSFDFNGIFPGKGELDDSLSRLEDRARELSMQIFRISLLYDVDVPEDLEILNGELAKNPDLAPHTRILLKRLKKIEPTSDCLEKNDK